MDRSNNHNAHSDDRLVFRRRNFKFKPHVLCKRCSALVSSSELLPQLDSWRWPFAASKARHSHPSFKLQSELRRLKLDDAESEYHRLLQRRITEERSRNDGRQEVHWDAAQRPILFPNRAEMIGDNRPSYCGHTSEPANDTLIETFDSYAKLDDVCTSAKDNKQLFYPMGYLSLMVKHPSLGSTCGTGLVQTAGHLYCELKGDSTISLTISEPGRDRNMSARDDMTLRCDAQLYGSTASDAHVKLASSWLRNCEKHSRCQAHQQSSDVLPTRLLDLGLPASEAITVTLCYTRQLGHRPSYVTLSHCWGTAKSLTLTKANEGSMLRGLDWDKLPTMFRDAACVSRQLGFRFLWIDSLCIMQDVRDDWERESSIMGQIYLGCALNISALWAKDCNDGLVVTRQPLLRRPCALVSNTVGGEKVGIWARALDTKQEYEHERSLLGTRAWVVQERMLAPRTLHFGPEGISWECRYGDASEDSGGLSTCSWYETIRPKQDLAAILNVSEYFYLGSRVKINDISEGGLRVHQKWVPLVEYYTRCCLTYRQDVLIALNGLVRTISDATNMHNVAGIWTDCIILELLWFALDQNPNDNAASPQSSSNPSKYLAPSWSWASLGRQVNFSIRLSDNGRQKTKIGTARYQDVNIDMEAQLVEASSQGMPNGLLHSAFTRITGWVKKVCASETINPRSFDGDRNQLHPYHTPSPAAPPPNRLLWDAAPDQSEEFWLILLVRCQGQAGHWEDCTRWDECMSDLGLILELVGNEGGERVFRRLGMFEQLYVSGDDYQPFARSKLGEKENIMII